MERLEEVKVIKKFFKSSYLLIVLLFIYIPVAILIFFSFNQENSLSVFNGHFSLNWYKNFFDNNGFVESIVSSLLVAIISTIVSVIIGTLAAIGISKAKRITQTMTLNITNIPLINADVVTAVSLMMLFLALSFKFGLLTLILAHISFNIPYVIITVLPGLRRIPNSVIEASLDLGASPRYTLRKVILPLILPSIIAASVISFAMSFDDFIISYFTGGGTTNVGTYIYTLKKLTPIVNAFGTLLISIVVVLVLGWNIYTIIKNHFTSRNQAILKEKYRAKEVVRLERKLLMFYLQLNTVGYDNEKDVLRKLTRKIFHLELKVQNEKLWVKTKKAQLLRKDRQYEKRSAHIRDKYYWLVRWPWKGIAIISLAFLSLGALTYAYVRTNLYDLKIGIWGEYTSPAVIRAFEKKYNVRIKEENYDKNEVLYNKVLTTYYDIVVPSDYMATRFIKEGKAERIDWTKLMPLANEKSTQGCNVPAPTNSAGTLWDYLDCTVRTSLTSSIYEVNNSKLSEYAVPYFWGDLVLLVNLEKPSVKEWLEEQGVEFATTDTEQLYMKPETVSWELLWMAARDGKNVYALNDHRSLYGIAFQLINQTVNARDQNDIIEATALLKELIVDHKKNVTLKSDMMALDLKLPPSDMKSFDIGVMYNGDAVTSFMDADDELDLSKVKARQAVRPKKLTNGKPQGTNIWTDTMMLTKASTKKDLAYKFIQFILQDKIQEELSISKGYNTPLIKASEAVVAGAMKPIAGIYLPASRYENGQWFSDITEADGGFKDEFIAEITDQYNRQISANLG